MQEKISSLTPSYWPLLFPLIAFVFTSCFKSESQPPLTLPAPVPQDTIEAKATIELDTLDYSNRFRALVAGAQNENWNKADIYPNPGALLPFNRIVAYYGNFYSKRMGILGELPPVEMLEKLMGEVASWEAADTTTKVKPAIHYIAITAQKNPGKGNKYRQRMPKAQIEKAIDLAAEIDAIVILDVQVGMSTLQEELTYLDTFLAMPHVHLGIDPEFSMKTGARPGKKIGSFDAADVNYASKYLAGLVNLYELPPKILIVHRFTKPMLTNYDQIELRPEVQLVVQMDGWGGKAKKKGTYRQVIQPEPVQFAGFKVFYKHDTQKVNAKETMQPDEILQLVPKPIYIQYQ